MNRPEKIALLKAIQSGKSLQEALPTNNITLIEYVKGRYADIDAGTEGWIKADQAEEYLQRVKAKHPNHLIRSTIMPLDEFERLSAELEKEY